MRARRRCHLFFALRRPLLLAPASSTSRAATSAVAIFEVKVHRSRSRRQRYRRTNGADSYDVRNIFLLEKLLL